MVITVGAELETALNEHARQRGVSPHDLALEVLRSQFLAPMPPDTSGDDWVRRLRRVATDCGVALSDAAVGSEGLYE
jgi:hypothetical protein